VEKDIFFLHSGFLYETRYMKKNFKRQASVIIPAIFFILANFIVACSMSGDDFDINKQLPTEVRDTLLVDIVTLMGVKPRNTDWQSRHDAVHRSFYIRQADDYQIAHYHMAPDGWHYFLMIRPTRSAQPEHRRAIGGRFIPDGNFYPQQYEEIFVTRQMDESRIREISESLFSSMITGNFEKSEPVEWPDERLKYDRNKKEWRYDVEE
jgi:hypothetical protein